MFQVDPQRHVVGAHPDPPELLRGETGGGHDPVEAFGGRHVVPVGRPLRPTGSQGGEGAQYTVHPFVCDHRGGDPGRAGPPAEPTQGQPVGHLETVRPQCVKNGAHPAQVRQDAVAA